MKTICVIGMGYIGLPTASLFANNGLKVHGVDTNTEVIRLLNAGRIHIEEIGLRTLVEAAVGSGNLKCSTTPANSDAFIVAVPTPIADDKSADLSFVFSAVDSIAPYLRENNLVVIESTVPPGTTRKVSEHLAKCRQDLVSHDGSLRVHVAHCPERVLPGQILKELVENDRIIGGLTDEATMKAEMLYRKIVAGRICLTEATTAEMVKLTENTFRDVNIALSNELSVICERLGINVWEVISLANNHPRVRLLSPGPGVGGHCIAVDPWFIVSEFPAESQVIKAARLRNDSMPGVVVEQIKTLTKGISPSKIACLGASYKANVGDPRNSPAIEVFSRLKTTLDPAIVLALNDPHVTNSKLPLQSIEDVLRDATLIVILTDHNEYKSLDPTVVARTVKRKLVLDTRNAIGRKVWERAGFQVFTLGDGTERRVVS